MALQGTIDAFPVVDVLQLLAGSRKTGRLIVEGDRSTAQLFVVDGSATGGGVQGVDDSALVDVVAELLRYREGSFLFEPGSEAPQPQDPEDLPALVDAAGEAMAAWAAIEAVVPSMSHRLSLCSEISDEGVHLSAADWPVVVAAGAGSRVGELVSASGASEIETCSSIAALVERGIVAVQAPTAELVLAEAPVAGPSVDPVTAGDVDPSAGDRASSDGDVDTHSGDGDVDGSTEDVAEYEVVLLDEDDDGAFPEHFPIDDLLGGADEEDPWVQLESAGREDRLAAAQTFGDEPSGPGADEAFSAGGLGSFDSSAGF
ncbi:MAG TPA: DUF4388 domain-containing protein, partial [Microthrixaceae bacterium]|nr:DUF4388 domain-containing protein [Microthrixaceae bacterium]